MARVFTRRTVEHYLPLYPLAISSGGTATFVAKSLAGPKTSGAAGAPPDAARIRTTNIPVYNALYLEIPQWIISGAHIDPRSSGPVYDWVQSRTKDVFGSASGDQATVLNAILNYTIAAIPSSGITNRVRAAQSPVVLNPYFTVARLDSTSQPGCGQPVARWFKNLVMHEARHAYQAARAAVSANDQDGDFLVVTIPVAPTNIVIDSTTSRNVCDQQTNTVLPRAYRGDTLFDQPQSPDYAVYAWEMDAWTFAGMHDH